MSFGISMKLAPGVRIGATTRGVRASVGPFSVSSASARRRRTGASRPSGHRASLAQLNRQAREAQREEQIKAVTAMEVALTTLHREHFPPSERQVTAAPAAPKATTTASRRRQAVDEATRGMAVFDRASRRAVVPGAIRRADDTLHREHIAGVMAAQRAQIDLDDAWTALSRHDPQTVIDEVDAAFADNASDSTCVDAGSDPVTGTRYISCVVVFDPVEMVPEQKAAVTPTGRPTVRKRNKTERNELYTRALGSTVLATAKEGLAVAVAAEEARVLVLRRDPAARSAADFVGIIYLGSFDRAAVSRAVDPIEALLAAPGAEILRKGATKEITNLRVTHRPDLQALVADFAASMG